MVSQSEVCQSVSDSFVELMNVILLLAYPVHVVNTTGITTR